MTNAGAGPVPPVRPLTVRRFVACLGYVDRPTNEDFPRRLARPGTGATINPVELLPVRQIINGGVKFVGTIYDVFLMGDMIQGIGFLAYETEADRVRVRAIADGDLFLELDVKGIVTTEPTENVWSPWRVVSVTLGMSPVWDSLPVHVWEG